jgi:transposase
MLKVENVQAITDYCRGLGKSARQAARVFRVSRNTVARVLREGVEGIRPGDVRRRRPQVLLEEHQRYIDEVLLGREGGPVWGKQRHNGLSIANLLREHRGYAGSVSQVRRYIQRRRGDLGLLPRGDVTLDRVKEPRALAEADWTEVKIYLGGVFTTIWLLVVRFRFSGAHFVRGYRATDTESLLDGLQRAFEWFQGVPPVLQMDNMTVSVSKVLKGRRRVECKLYAAFRAHYGYRGQYTMVACPDENGAVEATMGPVARWLVPLPCVTRMADLNGYLAGCCEQYLNHQIRDRTGLVGANFAVEKNLLIPLPPRRYDTGREDRAGVSGQSRFLYREVWYSVPVAYRSREVVAKGYAEEVTARCDGREIARHARGFQKGELVLNPLHYLPVLYRKPHALDHAAAFRGWKLPLIYERFRQELEKRSATGLREYVEVLGLLRQFPQRDVTAALRRSAATRVFSAEAVRFHLRLAERRQDAPTLETADRWGLPQVEIARPDLTRYEALAI